MSGRVVAVRVGRARMIAHYGGRVRTGILKRAVDGPVMARPGGLIGDGQADRKVHGGPDMAIYLYAQEDYDWWAAELGRPIAAGRFGENLTVRGLGDAPVRCGERFRIGAATLAATGPREPCHKLGIAMGEPRFVPAFREAGRTGFYARVIAEGPIAAGDPITRQDGDPNNPTIAAIHAAFVGRGKDRAALEALLAGPDLPRSWRDWCLARLADRG